LALVHLSGDIARLAGILTLLGSAVLLAVVLIEGAFTMDIALASAHGHMQTALTSFDIMGRFIHIYLHIYLVAPAPVFFLSLGTVLLGSHVLPRALGYLALGLRRAYVK